MARHANLFRASLTSHRRLVLDSRFRKPGLEIIDFVSVKEQSLIDKKSCRFLTFSHLSHLFRRFLGSRVDVSNHDEPALSICSTLWAYVVFFHILFYSVHPSQFRSAPGSGSWNLSRQDILCYIVFFSPLNMTEPGQSFLREESVYWLYVGIFTDGSISNMIFSCLSLHPSQHLHFCCIYPSLITFPYRPTFPSICHCRSNCRFIYLVLQCFGTFLSQMTHDISRHLFQPD